MFKRFCAVVLLLILLFAPTPLQQADAAGDALRAGSEGDAVVHLQMRLRDLGYYNYKITGSFGSLTESAVIEFQKANKLASDGVIGEQTSTLLYSNEVKRKPATKAAKAPPPSPTPKSNIPSFGKLVEWSKIHKAFPRGDTAKVVDLWSGISYNVTRVGGSLHADVEPSTKADTKKLKNSYGGSWSWDRRPVIVYIGGEWVAGSTNGMPHGYETVGGNGMDGQVCIHFLNSKTHIRGLKDSDHQAMVKRAAGR